MKSWLKKTFRSLNQEGIEPLITISLHKNALLENLREFQKVIPENKVAPVLKSNAYGHGLVEIATMLDGKAEFFIIDSYFEAQVLRAEGIRTPLLAVGYVRPEIVNNSKLKNIAYTISSLDSLFSITSSAKIHLKIDTGMHRQGISPDDLEQAFNFIKNNPFITLEGICSHLADADGKDPAFTEKQIWLWNSIVEKTLKILPAIKYTHLSNTFGHKFAKEIHANTSRLGIGLYGLADITGMDLKPVLEMKTIVTSLKKIKSGESVGYNNTFLADKDMTTATIPVGYYEALDRRLSNKGFVKVGNTFCPIIGRVSMNIASIDVSNIPNIKVGDEVQVISANTQDKNSIESIANICETITYEVAVKINGGIRRVRKD